MEKITLCWRAAKQGYFFEMDIEDVLTLFFENLPERNPEPLWITIGNFDGLHLGHQALLNRMKQDAANAGCKSAMVTFQPHPRVVLQNISGPFYLACEEEKRLLLAQSGLDYVFTLPFDRELASQSAGQFFSLLLGHLNVRGLTVSENFALGRDRSGTLEQISRLCADNAITMDVMPAFCLDGAPVSSGRVREALEAGDVRAAARLLGRPYFVKSKVVEGKRLGSKLGFPTANQVVHPQKILPQYGVYATRASFNGEKYMGVTSVGVRPTFENTTRPNIETLLLDFDDNIYHENLTVEFIEHLRAEIKFERVEDLIAQIEQDKREARRTLTHESFQENLPT